MYKAIIRPLLFSMDPERVHHLVVAAVKAINLLPGAGSCIRRTLFSAHTANPFNLAGLQFKSRVGLAAGFDKNADFYREFSMFGFGFIEIGTVTPKPQPGNPKPRLFRLPDDKALINRMGFNNKGVDYAVKNLRKRKSGLIVGGNIGKNTQTPNEQAADDYALCFEKLYDSVDYFAVNVSCPNIAGLEKLQDHDSLRGILVRIMQLRAEKIRSKPVFLKISPDLSCSHIDEILELVRELGLDGLIVNNTTTSREGLRSDAAQINRIGKGGLSGRPLTIRTLETIRYICKQSGNTVPVIGVGGIMNVQDALDMMDAGASLVQVYTGFIYEGPFLVRDINRALGKSVAGNIT